MISIKIKAIINQYAKEDTILNDAINYVTLMDGNYERIYNKDLITKIYYIAPHLNRMLVVVDNGDKETLKLDSNVLLDTKITDYPLVKLPSQIIDYKELIIKKDSELNEEEIKNAAQYMVDNEFSEVQPNLMPVVKVIDYRTEEPANQIYLPGVFGENLFEVTDSINLVTDGDSTSGEDTIKNAGIKGIIIDDLVYWDIKELDCSVNNDEMRKKVVQGIEVAFHKYELSNHTAQSGDQKTESNWPIIFPLKNLNPKKEYVRFKVLLNSYDNYYKYNLMIRDVDNNVIFQFYTKGKGADKGIDAPHEKEFYLYMPVLKETAQYYFSEAWGKYIKIYEMKVISKDELPEDNSVSEDGLTNIIV